MLALDAGGRRFRICAALARMELKALVSILTEEWASESLLNKGVYYGKYEHWLRFISSIFYIVFSTESNLKMAPYQIVI